MMTFFRFMMVALALGFVAVLAWAQQTDPQSLPDAFMAMFNAPWTTTAIVDLYLGFFLAATLIVIAEKKVWVGLAWGLPIFLAGNVVTLLWFALRLPRLVRQLRQD
ncbi:MAG: hypothetical protein AAFR72_08435 [Pseudomonadota bacterium]